MSNITINLDYTCEQYEIKTISDKHEGVIKKTGEINGNNTAAIEFPSFYNYLQFVSEFYGPEDCLDHIDGIVNENYTKNA